MARFYHIGVNIISTEKTAAVDAALNIIAPDWLRYTFNNWIVWTDKTAQQLTDQLRPVLPTDKYLILPVENTANRQGWMTNEVWDWLNKVRPPGFTQPFLPQPTPPRRLGSPPPSFDPFRPKKY